MVIAGRGSYAESGEVTAEALRALAAALPKATFLPALRRGNVFGALDMGLSPGLLPGRIALDEGRRRFTAVWGSVPETAGRSTAEILASMADETTSRPGAGADGPPVTALVLLGSDPLSDFPDHEVAKKALSSGHFVVAVTGHPSQSVDAYADVVLPCSVAHERPGTTTNLEGRGQPPRSEGHRARLRLVGLDDRRRGGRRAREDLGHRAGRDLTEEMALAAPAYAGLTEDVLQSDGAHDGLVVPLGDGAGRSADVEPIDPVALPGVESVERQGAPPRVGTGVRAHAPARARTWGPSRLCSPSPGVAGPSRSVSPRPTTTRCASWRAAASTTPAAPSRGRRR